MEDYAEQVLYGIYSHVNALPPSVFHEHKVYPTCHCGRKYVPIKECGDECFFCYFTKHGAIVKPKNLCIKCGDELMFSHKSVCDKCVKEREREYQRHYYQTCKKWKKK